FTQYASGSGSSAYGGALGNASLPLATIATLLPGSAQGVPPTDPYQYAFTVRLRVTDNLGNVGEDRKTLFLYHDPTLHPGWPKFTDTGGEQSLRMADLDGNGALELVAANTSGEIAVYNADGTPASYFNGGSPFVAPVPALGSAAIGDLDQDGTLDIAVASMDQHAYAWDANGNLLPGWPVLLKDSDAAHPNGVGAESINTPAIGDIDGDGFPDVVVATNEIYDVNGSVNSMTDSVLQALLTLAGMGGGNSSRLYAIEHDGTQHAGGPFLPGWPVKLGDLD